MKSLNDPYSTTLTRRRYEVWFLRLGLSDGRGAWWFRYLIMNPGRNGCPDNSHGMPAQVWATWFPADGAPQSFIQEFPLVVSRLSSGGTPFALAIADNAIDNNSCRGRLNVDGHAISWNLRYSSSFAFTMSSKGWIGFSRTPHADAAFEGTIEFDGRRFEGKSLGFGLQGHNCGYRHRNFWTWAHAYFRRADQSVSMLEALTYEMPLGLVFRKVVLWHRGASYTFHTPQEARMDRDLSLWSFNGFERGVRLNASIQGNATSTHRLQYLKTNCAGTFDVLNNSRASARLQIEFPSGEKDELFTPDGAVLEMAGNR
ncbi:MAG TPA: hypothetical protein VHR84_15275 [Terriglobales bacterium]|nr:hypothetical protein [Terriglobales bacterium]